MNRRIASPEDQVATLEKLLAIPVVEPRQALTAAADLVAAAFAVRRGGRDPPFDPGPRGDRVGGRGDPRPLDPRRLRQCIENIVANAVKHSPAGKPVEVALERRRTVSGVLASIAVTDGGPGVKPELAPHVFERFVTGSSGGLGLGLGLFLARQIAIIHRGDLVIESPASGGARFVITLPCNDPEEG